MAAYPRKQTVVIFAICAIAVGGVSYYSYGPFWDNRNPQTPSSPTLVAAVDVQGVLVSNNDWQKQFLGSDSATSTAYKATTPYSVASGDKDLTPADKLGRNFFTQYAQLNQAGLTNDPQTVSDSMGQVASQTVGGLSGPKVYSLNDIVIGANGTPATASYGNSLISVFNSMPNQNEAVIAQQAFDDNDMSELAEIDPVITSYSNMISKLVKVPTPRPLAQYQLNLINGLSIALYNAESFRHMDTDPVQGLSAVSLEVIGLQNISLALSNIQNYFISAGVPLGS